MIALLLLFGLIILLVLGALLSRLPWTERTSFIGWHGRRRKRARAVLLSCLSPQQRAEFLTSGSFEVIAGSGNRYLISSRRMGNIQHLDEHGRLLGCYCSVLKDSVPIEDQMLAQKLMLESDDLQLRRVAHRTSLRAPRVRA